MKGKCGLRYFNRKERKGRKVKSAREARKTFYYVIFVPFVVISPGIFLWT
jgi:hypothetical protein